MDEAEQVIESIEASVGSLDKERVNGVTFAFCVDVQLAAFGSARNTAERLTIVTTEV